MTSHSRGPLDGVERLVVDGTNLLHQIGRGGAAPPATIIGRVRAAVPAHVFIDVVFDGTDAGPKGRVATGMYVRFAGRRTADDMILEIVASEVRATVPTGWAGSAAAGASAGSKILVITDDRELRLRLQAQGVGTARSHWLLNRLALPTLSAPAAGNRRAPAIDSGAGARGGGANASTPGGAKAEDDRKPWAPGRGATTKHGTARKVARHKRKPRAGAG
jgi:hypothetical protein